MRKALAMQWNRWMTMGLAARDLAGRRDWPTSAAMFCTVVVVTGVCLASYGLVLGRWRVERRRIDRDAWAMVLRVGNNLTTRGALNEKVLGELRRKLDQRFPHEPKMIRAIHPYRSCVDKIQTFESGTTRCDLRGRTVYFSEDGPDLYLSGHRIVEPGRGFTHREERGLLLTPRGVAKLGLNASTQPPFRVKVEVGVKWKDVKVIGVFSEDLPDHYEFLITEAYEQELMRGDPHFPYIVSGTMPPRWREGDGSIAWDEPDAWRSLFQGGNKVIESIESIELRDDQLRLQASSVFDQSTGAVRTTLSESAWRDILKIIAEAMRKRTGVAAPEFEKFHADGREIADANAPYDLVNVYVNEAGALAPAADICDEVVTFDGQGTVNRDVIRRLESIDLRLRDSMRTVHVQQTVIVLLCAFSLSVLQVFRAIGKTNEIGMMRAMGMTRRQVVAFIVLQAIFLALLGAGLGMALGGVAAFAVSYFVHGGGPDALLGVLVPYSLVAVIAAGAAAISLVSGFVASWRWFVHDPSSLMR